MHIHIHQCRSKHIIRSKLQDSCAKIIDILRRKPDLVIGNYTDGNLVASLVSRKLGVTQVKNRCAVNCSVLLIMQ